MDQVMDIDKLNEFNLSKKSRGSCTTNQKFKSIIVKAEI